MPTSRRLMGDAKRCRRRGTKKSQPNIARTNRLRTRTRTLSDFPTKIFHKNYNLASLHSRLPLGRVRAANAAKSARISCRTRCRNRIGVGHVGLAVWTAAQARRSYCGCIARIQWRRWIGCWLGAVARRDTHGRFATDRIGSQRY